MNKELALLNASNSPDTELSLDFIQVLAENIEVALSTLSDKNRKQYESTLSMWSDYNTPTHDYDHDFDLIRVRNFLTNPDWSFNTRKTRLAHLRKYAEILALSDKDNLYNFGYNYGRLNLLKPKSLGGKKSVIKHKALTNKQVYTVFDSLVTDNNSDTRNRAILGLMLLAGLRSNEIVNLLWEDVDIKGKLIFVRDGKGNKSAHIPMLGDLHIILRLWQEKQRLSGDYDYVVCIVWRSDALGRNKKCTTRVIQVLTDKISDRTGVHFNPHDTRRTAITALISSGASVAEVRDFARHSSGETTLRYAQKSIASTLGRKLRDKLKYGDVLGVFEHPENTRYWECISGHGFHATNPKTCPKCGSDRLSHQESMFDD